MITVTVLLMILGAAVPIPASPSVSGENLMTQSSKILEASPVLCERAVDFVLCADPQPG